MLCRIFVAPAYALESSENARPKAEIIAINHYDATISEDAFVDDLSDKTRGVKKPPTGSVWDIYLQDYVFNLNFEQALYTNYNFSNHGGEIQVSVTCHSSNPGKIKMELYEAGEDTCLATFELNPDGTTLGKFYNLNLKTNYYFKFVSPDGYSVTGKGRLYKDSN